MLQYDRQCGDSPQRIEKIQAARVLIFEAQRPHLLIALMRE
jgi:hypothetical protein